ncbi:tRNA lysidine(34) synthetase TilS [Rhizobium sp. 32-5/1]|uniref:tRNA lysidine(34) synthetase TilS n=1 Tax=Rhizobium sp. 32-5/1 TaxID=3019602 RepID=UPI00240CFBB3|nr:tRNA lysidine(34) synthetase TilS [Rhizobium sp. 32-5/1]WEZ82609.1 tRNA lysidine(34) synthetase TilS [Rhizobium sp. 32-5/1]
MPAKAKSTGTAAVRDAARQFLNRFKKPGLILVAVSGGSDSKGLLIALHEAMVGMPGFSLAACTVDHALRPESAAEANAVAQLCARLGFVHLIRRWDGEKPPTGLQAAARNARYSLLSAAAQETGALCVVTGHSRNDQIETIVMRSVRSSRDSTGFSGMADAVLFDRMTWILRPFLDLDRVAISRLSFGARRGLV